MPPPEWIPAEQLVTPLAHLTHNHPCIAGELRDIVQGHTNDVADRLVLVIDHALNELNHVDSTQPAQVVFRSQHCGDLLRVRQLVCVTGVFRVVPD